MSLRFNGKTFECPRCGPVGHVLEFDKVWLCYKVYPSPQDPNHWEYERNEGADVPTDNVEYECPKCKETFYAVEGLK
ncbi:MAG: hypothetical protein QW318_08120 [Candidatus Caldarchaeum sp.]